MREQRPLPAPTDPPRRDRLAPVLKWVGAASAVLALGFSIQRVAQMVGDHRERDRVRDEQLAAAALHEEAGRWDAAWAALDAAAERAPRDDSVQARRERLAMRWLREARAPEGGPTFTDLAERVQPVLVAGATESAGARKAALLAHLGWADFLRWREGARELRPEARYQEALVADSTNVHAHAYLAHWIAWRGGDTAETRRHFDAALAADAERPLVRGLQLASARNRNDDAGDRALVALAVALRRGEEPLGTGWARELGLAYDRQWKPFCRDAADGPRDVPAAALAGEPAAEHAATLGWLAAQPEGDGHDVLLARLHEACALEMAGRRDEALAALRRLRPDIPDNSRYGAEADRAIRRLSGARAR